MSQAFKIMSISRFGNLRMTSVLILFITVNLVVEASSSARFLSSPAFKNKIEIKYNGRTNSFPTLSSSQRQEKMLFVRGGAKDDEGKDDAVETGEDEDSDDDEEYDETDDSSDEEDYYDDETEIEEDEEEESGLASQLKKKSSIIGEKEKSSESIVEPYFISPSLQMYTTFGTILLSRKIDMFNPKVVRLVRLLFIVYLIAQQAFIFYVRIMAKRNNDRTPVQVQNPLTSMLTSQLEKQPAGANDMVKNLASSFLKTESTVAEYDMSQTQNMQGGILFNIALMWFLHFKMQQVQPLLVTSVNGFLQLAYNPLFQVYVLGRNLERPFKSPEVFKDPRLNEQSATTETTTQDGETPAPSVESESDEVGEVVEEGNQDESNDEINSSDGADVVVDDEEEEIPDKGSENE